MGSRAKLALLYVATSGIIYSSFWLGYFFINYVGALIISAVVVVMLGIIFAFLRHKAWTAMSFTLGISFAIGLSLSALFSGLNIPASRFLGLTLLVMIAYKSIQLALTHLIHSRKVKNTINAIFIVLEIAAIVTVFACKLDKSICYQMLITGIVAIFYSLGIFALLNSEQSFSWRTAAVCYFIGFALIFIIIVLLIISIVSEDGSPFEVLGQFIGEGALGMSDVGSGKKSKIKHVF